MEASQVVEALLEIWDELPCLLGREVWKNLYAQFVELEARLRQAETAPERTKAVTGLVHSLRPYPAALSRFQQMVNYVRTERGGDTSALVPEWHGVLGVLSRHLHPKTVTRYTNILAPRRAQIGKPSTLVVSLTEGPEADSLEAVALTAKASLSLEVSLHSPSSALEILPPSVLHLLIPTAGPSSPVAFQFKGTALGPQQLFLEFRQTGLLLGRVLIAFEVISTEPLEEERREISGPVLGDRSSQPADLEIAIETRGPEKKLIYRLNSPNRTLGFHHYEITGPALQTSPQEHQAALLAKLENLQKGLDIAGRKLLKEEIPGKLAGIGRDLYEELFPFELRQVYRDIRNAVQTIQITTTEPWIAWELIKPYEPHTDPAQVIDDDFLGCRFAVTRWFAGRWVPAGSIRAGRLACIEAGAAPDVNKLPFAAAERKLLADLSSAHGIQDASPSSVTVQTLTSLLATGGTHILHFVAHGDFPANQPNEASLLLSDNAAFRAGDLQGPLANQVSRDKPLVFLNACRAGRQGWALTRLDGWAKRWVSYCGCGMFVAPVWSVSDKLAFEIAKVFYKSLEEGEGLGAAIRSARLEARNLSPDSPAWLAYIAYGHPNGRLILPERA